MVSLNEVAQQVGAEPFRWDTVNPESDYNRDGFLPSYSAFMDLNKWADSIKKNPHDLSAREKLGKLLTGDKSFHRGLTPEDMLSASKGVSSYATDNTAKYVEHNLNKFLHLISDEGWQGVVLSAPLYLTGKDKYDEVVKVIWQYKDLGKIAKENDAGKMNKYVAGMAKNPRVPKWAAKMVKDLGDSEVFVRKIFGRQLGAHQQLVGHALSDEKGKPDVAKMRDLVTESINKAKEAYSDEEQEGDKGDIWDNDIKPIYLELAKHAYIAENQKYNEETETESDRIKRAKERMGAGM